MVRVTWKVTLGWAWAGAIVLLTLPGCSGDDAEGGSSSGGSGGTAGSSGAAGSAGSSGAGGSSTASGGSGGSQTGGSSSTGGGGGSGGSAPAKNCGALTCASGEICISSESLFVDEEESNECAAPPDGCQAWALCDCGISDWNGSPVWGCVALGTSTLYVYDLSCGDAPCEDGEVCLVDETESSPPTCVDAPADCTVDETFCSSGCGEQVAEAAGMDYVKCQASSVGAGVTVTP